MASVKTTINIDEETWKRFKKTVSSRYGGIRNLSGAVEEAIKCFNTEGLLSRFMEMAGIGMGAYDSGMVYEMLEARGIEAVIKPKEERQARYAVAGEEEGGGAAPGAGLRGLGRGEGLRQEVDGRDRVLHLQTAVRRAQPS